jgi:hypothetical protein
MLDPDPDEMNADPQPWCCGSWIPDPNFFHPGGSRILGQKDFGLDPDPHQRI